MIENYFKWDSYLRRVLSTPAGPHLSSLAEELHSQGFSYWNLRERLQGAAHFSHWNQQQQKSIEHLHENRLGKFEIHLRTCECPRPLRLSKHHDDTMLAGARALIKHLRHREIISEPPPMAKEADPPVLFSGFCVWMKCQRGTQETTLRAYGRVIKNALHDLGADPRRYDAESIRNFIFCRTKGRSRANAKEVTTVMRMFLRYLIAEGKCRVGMDDAVPTIAMWRLSALPRYLPAVDIERIVASCDRDTAVGLRDRAAVLLMARLGLRAGDIRKMDLSDIDWRDASIRVSGKTHHEVKLPLTQEVGAALLEYLRRGRPPVQDSTLVFVTMLAPWKPLQVSSVSGIVERAIARTGIEAQFRGAHVLRHSAATAMLREGANLQQIGAILRHQYLDTTAHYAKVDVNRLSEIALPWPEVFPC